MTDTGKTAKKAVLTREEIKNILPHRDAMLLLDEVAREEDVAVGKLHINGDEWFLRGHFPGNPVVPGVILGEILAQSACILVKDEMTEEKLPFYTGMNHVKFHSPVKPGDTFTTRCRIRRSKGSFYFAEGSGYVDGRLCVRGEFSFAIIDRKKEEIK